MGQQKRVGFVGLGDIGKPMAKNLIKNGFALTICGHMNRAPIEELKALGAIEVKSPKEVAGASDVVLSAVRDEPQTDAVMYGETGVLQGIKKGATLIIHSTIHPQYCQRLACAAKEKEANVLGAPVSGARAAAEAGTLTLMIGGDREVFEECRPILEAVGKNIFYLGDDAGAGEVIKLVNNLVLFGNMAVASEAVRMGLQAGAKLAQILDVLKVSTGNSWVIGNWESSLRLKRDWERRGMASTWGMMHKDLETALAVAWSVDAYLPIAELVSQIDVSRLFPESAD
jgi:3-hydroxyisobutyrate dehydrogenase-like beta-hydroxyacid dehydrogenase